MVTAGGRLGRYRVGALLARGGMGEIHSASRDDAPGLRLVLKLVRAEGASRNAIQMFLDEARVSTLVRHPNVVTVHEVGYDAGVYFMAMEELSGVNLSDLLAVAREREVPVPVPVILQVGKDVCDALQAVHECKADDGRPLNLVHRDVTPSNLFVTREGSVKLLDFGVAKSSVQLGQTEVGVIKGTAAYMAPEQAAGGEVDARSDLFSFGAILHELVTGRRLFKRDNIFMSLHAICHEPTPSPIRPGVTLPPRLVEAIVVALEKDPERRPRTARHLKAMLHEADAAEGRVASHAAVKAFVDALQASAWDEGPTQDVIPAESLGRWATSVHSALSGRSEPVPMSDEFEAATVIDVRPPGEAEALEDAATEPDGGPGGTALHPLAAAPSDPGFFLAPTEIGSTRAPMFGGATVVSRGTVAGLKARWASVRLGAGWWIAGIGLLTGAAVVGALSLFDPALGGARSWVRHDPADPAAPEEPLEVREGHEAVADTVSAGPEGDRPGDAARGSGRSKRAARHAGGAARKTGRLSLDTVPKAKVYLGGRLLGATPLEGVVVPAGTLELRVVNAAASIDRKVTVRVPLGRTVKKKIQLR